MLLDEHIKEILVRNQNLRKSKDDQTVKSTCVRVMNLFVTYGFVNLDEKGEIIALKRRKLDTLTNFELLALIETVICSNDKILIDDFLLKSIQSIDHIGQSWYYPKELSILIFEATSKRHNYRKIKIILNKFVAENVCLKITDRKRQSLYRIAFTHSSEN